MSSRVWIVQLLVVLHILSDRKMWRIYKLYKLFLHLLLSADEVRAKSQTIKKKKAPHLHTDFELNLEWSLLQLIKRGCIWEKKVKKLTWCFDMSGIAGNHWRGFTYDLGVNKIIPSSDSLTTIKFRDGRPSDIIQHTNLQWTWTKSYKQR